MMRVVRPLPSSHGIEISTLFDFIELFLLTFVSVAIYWPFCENEGGLLLVLMIISQDL